MSTMIGKPSTRSQRSQGQDAQPWWESQAAQPLYRPAPTSKATSRARARSWRQRIVSPALSPFLVLGYIAYILLNIGDLVSTWVGIHSGLREGNPLMHALLVQNGFGALILYKAVVIVVVGAGMLFLAGSFPRVSRITLLTCNVLIALAVAANVVQMLWF